MIISGFGSVLTPIGLFLILAGTFIGIVFGVIPGLSTAMAVALCLPITYVLSPANGIAMIMGLFVGGVSGGLISAILINIPGTNAALATTFDGFPMAQKGEAPKALCTGIFFSLIGTIVSTFALLFIAPLLAKFALKFSPVEYFAIGVFSLTMMATLSGKSIIKGLISGFFGLTFAQVGIAPIDYTPRFTFGFIQAESGFGLIAVLTGAYAVGELLKNAKASRIKEPPKNVEKVKISGLGFTLHEFLGQWFNCIRSALIGIGIGILPGIGAGTANLIAYSAAKNGSKYPEKFGTGIMDGIVASETANNASVGGALIPLLTLGIPGDVGTAMLLGGLMIHGINPGPLLFATNPGLVYTIFSALLIAGTIMVILEYFGIRVFIKILDVKKSILMPLIMVLCCVGAFGYNNRTFDIICLFFFGIFGYLMHKFRYPIAPMMIGFILGPMVETNLRRSLMASEGSLLPFIQRPIAVMFFLLTIFSVVSTMRKRKKILVKTNVLSDDE
jgi:putative tricarboxylic transport membrane protein